MKHDDLIIYEIFPLAFKTLENSPFYNIKNHLKYLNKIGVNAIWLTPVFLSPFCDSGYDVSDYYLINEDLGSFNEFKDLIKTANEVGIKIILDFVPNHTSNEHEWFKKSVAKDEYFKDFYIWKKGIDGNPPNNWQCQKIKDSTWKYVKERDEYYLHIYSDFQPDLNFENENVIKELGKAMAYWLNLGVFGFRLDVVNKIAKDVSFPNTKQGESSAKYYVNLPQCFPLIDKLKSEIKNHFEGDFFLLGQTEGVDLNLAHQFLNNENEPRLDYILEFSALRYGRGENYKNLTNFTIKDILNAYTKWLKEDKSFRQTTFLGNHDSPRPVSRHNDQGYGEIISKSLAIFTIMLRAIPIIYFGEELGVKNIAYDDIKDYKDIRTIEAYEFLKSIGENEKTIMQGIKKWSRDNARFHIDFTNFEKNEFYKLYKTLIQYRKENFETLSKGELNFFETSEIIGYEYKTINKEIMVIMNLTDHEITHDFIGYKNIFKNTNTLKPYEATVLEK